MRLVFFVLSSDECYFPWPFVKVDFVKKNLIETISSKWHSGTILCVELGFFCFPYECYFALLILCGISEMLDFSGVDFIRSCFLLWLFRLV